MATAPATAGYKKLSFAKVVASHPKESIPIVSASRVAVPTMDRRMQSAVTPATPVAAPVAANKDATTPAGTNEPPVAKPSLTPSARGAAPIPQAAAGPVDSNKIIQGVKDMTLTSAAASVPSTPSLVVNGSSSSAGESQTKNDNGTSVSDDISQRADSNSEMGTKAPSLDGKSITSGTTFALDEKESLRPDDSASVKAAAEDDEAFSFRGSMITNARIGSDIARIHRLRIGDMPERRIVQILPEAREQGVVTPQSGDSNQQPAPEKPQVLGTVGVGGPTDVFNSMYGQNPDDKLLEAMQSPKDRLFLLRLEQDVINFVQSSKEPYMDLPPNNSFCRMLTHKLADYYHMTHSFEAVQGAVRIYRTPFCRVPPSLASIAGSNANSNTNTPPPMVLPKKIMRRGEDEYGQGSTSASKATSEVGSDGKEKTGHAKEKMTREEREEAYIKARERIFGCSQGESALDDDANGMSRASSVSARDKSNLGRRGKTGRQRRNSESFEPRSQFKPYYPPHPQQPMEWAPQFIPTGNVPYNGAVQQPYQYPVQAYQPQPQPQAYPPMMPNSGYTQYSNMPAYAPQPQQTPPRYPPSNGSMGGYGTPAQAAPHQTWQPSFSQTPSPGPYQNRAPQTPGQTNAAPVGIPYAYGQLPANSNPHDLKSQHPIPGSYNRHAFNPKTQSFVPGNGMSPVQPAMVPYIPGPHEVGGSPHMAYNSYSSPAPPQPQPYMGGPGYGMSRQSSNNSLPAYHPPQHLVQHPPTHLPQIPHQMPHKPGIPQQGPTAGPGQVFSHLPNYGNPATLPQKPPPSGI